MAGKVNPLISMVAANQANYPCQARSLPLGTLIPPMSAGLGVLARGEQAFAAGHRTSGLRLRRPNACVPLWSSHTDDGGHIWGEPSS
jgi:hypothetical protein